MTCDSRTCGRALGTNVSRIPPDVTPGHGLVLGCACLGTGIDRLCAECVVSRVWPRSVSRQCAGSLRRAERCVSGCVVVGLFDLRGYVAPRGDLQTATLEHRESLRSNRSHDPDARCGTARRGRSSTRCSPTRHRAVGYCCRSAPGCSTTNSPTSSTGTPDSATSRSNSMASPPMVCGGAEVDRISSWNPRLADCWPAGRAASREVSAAPRRSPAARVRSSGRSGDGHRRFPRCRDDALRRG